MTRIITLAEVLTMDKGEQSRVGAGRWKRRLLANPGKRCLAAWIRVVVVEREEVVRFQIYVEGRQGLPTDGM